MFSFFSKKQPKTAIINSVPVTVDPKETLLLAALRNGIDFPHSCRVGGCGTCKCRLVDGSVRELTKFGYVLSDDELRQGYILACQSVPQTDIAVKVAVPAQQRRRVGGRVIGQDRLTRDITLLRIQLDESLHYKAGQFANISVAPLDHLARSFSFASPVQPDAQVRFFIKKVPGGALSTLVNETNVVGETVHVDGPLGDFWLRPGDAPLLMIAGGSGLAPILAILQEAMRHDATRPVTLLFGAQTELDLYALDEIDAIAKGWRGEFRFVPVLSALAADAAWTGQRGMVADKIAQLLVPGSHAYLCGPPPMVDACTIRLELCGIARANIYADRFATLHEPQAASA